MQPKNMEAWEETCGCFWGCLVSTADCFSHKLILRDSEPLLLLWTVCGPQRFLQGPVANSGLHSQARGRLCRDKEREQGSN